MPSRNKSLCIFGDSHIGSVAKALDGGLVNLTGFDVEFWGATGPLFRQIDMVDGVIRATGAEAAKVVAQVNGKGRETISAGDFDSFLFYGARLRMADFMGPYLHRLRDPQAAVSAAVLRAAAKGFVNGCRAARMACALASAGKARVFFVPAPLLTADLVDHAAPGQVLAQYPLAGDATPADRDRIWCAVEDVLGASGVTLIRQPEATVVQGVLTARKYAVEGAEESGDIGHKSAEFAALMLVEFLKAAS